MDEMINVNVVVHDDDKNIMNILNKFDIVHLNYIHDILISKLNEIFLFFFCC